MRKPRSAVPLLLLLLLPLAGCAHQNAGYAPVPAGYDCEFDSDCYGGFGTVYSCVFVENPAVPARLAVVVSPRHHAPRVVIRGDWTPSPSTDSSGSGSSSAGSPPQAFVAPAPVLREPVILPSPPAEGRTPGTPN